MADQEQNAGFPVEGYCPMGCGQTLRIAAGGCITCMSLACPRPDAAAQLVTKLLGDPETEHTAEIDGYGCTIRHPVRERLDDAQPACTMPQHIAALDGPPAAPGRYRVTGQPGGLRWEAIDG